MAFLKEIKKAKNLFSKTTILKFKLVLKPCYRRVLRGGVKSVLYVLNVI